MKEKQLTVGELVALLQKMPQDAPVYLYGTETEAECTGVDGDFVYGGRNDPPLPHVLLQGAAYH